MLATGLPDAALSHGLKATHPLGVLPLISTHVHCHAHCPLPSLCPHWPLERSPCLFGLLSISPQERLGHKMQSWSHPLSSEMCSQRLRLQGPTSASATLDGFAIPLPLCARTQVAPLYPFSILPGLPGHGPSMLPFRRAALPLQVCARRVSRTPQGRPSPSSLPDLALHSAHGGSACLPTHSSHKVTRAACPSQVHRFPPPRFLTFTGSPPQLPTRPPFPFLFSPPINLSAAVHPINLPVYTIT